jgi:tetratricopeptide (TPR) repeat protein
LARISADSYREAEKILGICSNTLGNYKQSISLCHRARDLLDFCGMSGSETDHGIMANQAEIHKLKSEYVEAQNIYTRILQEISVDQDSREYAYALLNIAKIDVFVGAPKDGAKEM